MRVKALCNVITGARSYGMGEVFEVDPEDLPGLDGLVRVIMDPVAKQSEEQPQPKEQPKPAEPSKRRTRKRQ